MLKAAGKAVRLGGNIGRPLLADAAKISPEDYAVLELSSFQLMTLRRSPRIAVITNVTPNHLDYHASMEEYAEAKSNIFRHQDKGGCLSSTRTTRSPPASPRKRRAR
jgi:UDP-N-acetylmuramoylalanine--D-glutamate ligase